MALEIKGKRKEKGLFPPFLFVGSNYTFVHFSFFWKCAEVTLPRRNWFRARKLRTGGRLVAKKVGIGKQRIDCSRSLLDRHPLLFDA